jgi:hypothetical protein
MSVIMGRDGGDLTRTRRLGLPRFETAVRREIGRWHGQRPCGRIVRQMFAALGDVTGVLAHRRGSPNSPLSAADQRTGGPDGLAMVGGPDGTGVASKR